MRELVKLEGQKPRRGWPPPNGTAGWARSRVSGSRRVPAPPARIIERILAAMRGRFRPDRLAPQSARPPSHRRETPAEERAATPCLVQMTGPSIGKRYPLGPGPFTIGREEGNTVRLEVDSVSRQHAQIFERDGGYFVADLGSTNGTCVNEHEVKDGTPLRSGDQLRVGRVIFKFLSGDDVESQYHEAIYTLAITDGLTRLHNKRYLLEFLEREMGRCHRYGRQLSLLLFDVDHFKRTNDTHGHLAGDFVLRELAAVVRPLVRAEQCLARYGGEGVALVTPGGGVGKAPPVG